MSGISCHVLDTSIGRPATNVGIRLERLNALQHWQLLGQALTNADGRAVGLGGSAEQRTGSHRLTFDTDAYFRRMGQPIFYAQVQVCFVISSVDDAYHIPLLLSPFGYSTYRGS